MQIDALNHYSKTIYAILIALLFTLAARAEEAELGWKVGQLGTPQPRRLVLVAEAPPRLIVPGDLAATGFARIPFGENSQLSLAILQNGVLVDTDFDSDLSDETVGEWLGLGTRLYRGVHLKLPSKGGAEPAEVEIMISMRTDGDKPRIWLTPRSYRAGRIIAGGRLRPCAVVDGNGDMRFDDPHADVTYIDVNGDGKLDTTPDSVERIRGGAPFALRRAGYELESISPDGGRLVLKRRDEAPAPTPRAWKPIRLAALERKASRRPKLAAVKKKLGRILDKPNKYALISVLMELGDVGSPESFAALRSTLKRARKQKNANLQSWVVSGMGFVEYREHAPYVAGIARTSKYGAVRAAAYDTLARMGDPAREGVYIRQLTREKDAYAFGVLARSLAATGSPTARQALLASIPKLPRLKHRDEAYRYGTRYFDEPPPIETMLIAAKTVEPRLRERGLRDLYYLGRPEAHAAAIAAAKDKLRSTGVALIVIEILAAEGDAQAIDALMPLADQSSFTVQARLVDLLGRVRDPGGIDVLIRELRAHSKAQRLVAARALARIPLPAVTEAIGERMPRERDEHILLVLVAALADHGGAHAVEALTAAAKRSEKVKVLRKPVMRALLRVGGDSPAAFEVFRAKLESRSWEERLLALDAAAASGRIDLAPGVIANLDHSVWQVRLVAARTLRSLRVREAVQPLIDRFAVEKEKRIRREVGRTLTNLTGQDFGKRDELWVRWWRDKRDSFELAPPRKKAQPKRARTGETRTVASFYGLPVESENVIFVIDQSGSMGSSAYRSRKTQYEIAVDQVLYAVKRMPDRSRINLIMFETDIHPWRKSLARLGGSTRTQLAKHLRANAPTGGTNLFDALEMALLTDKVDTVYLLSDGRPNGGKLESTGDILARIAQLNELRRITIHCVSIGRASTLLQQLAAKHGGEYVRK